MDTSNYALLLRSTDRYEVDLLRAALAAAGIDLIAAGGHSLVNAGGLTVLPAGEPIDVWVPKSSAEDARRVIDEYRARPIAPGARDWTCASCGETNEAIFELCWSCGAASPASTTEGA